MLLIGCILWIVFVLRVASVRFFKNPTGSLFNPLFYINILALFYIILPLTLIPYTLTVVKWQISNQVFNQAVFLSFWYSFVFFGFYVASKDHDVRFCSFNASPDCVIVAKCLNVILCLLLSYIILFKVPLIIPLRGTRGEAYSAYQTLIEAPFKLRIIMFLHIGVMYYLFAKYRKFRWLLPLLLYLLIDYSHGGRIASVMCGLFFYTMLVLNNRKTYLKYAILVIFIMLSLGVIQRSSGSDTDMLWKLYSGIMEFTNTYLTTIFMCGHPDFHMDLSEYLMWIVSKLFPGGIIGKMTGTEGWYGEMLSNKIDLGFGLGGNIITESLVYGGFVGSILNPLFIGILCYWLNSMKGKTTYIGSYIIILFCLPMQENFRQYFWGYIFYPLQLAFFWGIWVCPDWGKNIYTYLKTCPHDFCRRNND